MTAPTDSTEFQHALDAAFRAVDDARAARGAAQAAEMTQREAAAARFASVADTLLREVVQPRLQAVVARFPHATVQEGRSPAGAHLRATFAHTDQYPVTAHLTLGVLHDPARDVGSVTCSLDLVPQLFTYEKGDHCDFDPAAPDRAALAGFVEAKLLAFVRLYLPLETDERYQRATTHRDPVCGMTVTAASAAARAEHQRRTFYFCSTACRDKFVADPAFYLAQQQAGLTG